MKKMFYTPPQVWVIELRCEPCILASSGDGNGSGELPPNSNYSI